MSSVKAVSQLEGSKCPGLGRNAVAIASEARKVSQELAKQREYALISVSELGKKNQKLQEVFGERELQNHAHSSYISTGKRYNYTCCIRDYDINPESWRGADRSSGLPQTRDGKSLNHGVVVAASHSSF
jgi:hypothetical protein